MANPPQIVQLEHSPDASIAPLEPPNHQQREHRTDERHLASHQDQTEPVLIHQNREQQRIGHGVHTSSCKRLKSNPSGCQRLPTTITTAETAAENTAAQ